MPDDSTDSFREAQNKHANALAFERHLMNVTGKPRSEIRALIRSQEKRIGAVQVQQQPAQKAQPVPQVLAQPPQTFEAKPFRLDNNTVDNGAPQGGGGRTGTLKAIVINNAGTAETVFVYIQ